MARSGNMNDDGSCPDCGITPPIGAWPYACAGKGHILYVRLAFLGGGRTKDYDPPGTYNPISKPVVTRDWLSPDGTLRPMKPDEWLPGHDIKPNVEFDSGT